MVVSWPEKKGEEPKQKSKIGLEEADVQWEKLYAPQLIAAKQGEEEGVGACWAVTSMMMVFTAAKNKTKKKDVQSIWSPAFVLIDYCGVGGFASSSKKKMW